MTLPTLDYHQEPSGSSRVGRILAWIGGAIVLGCAIYFVVMVVVIVIGTRPRYTPISSTTSPDGRYSVVWTQVKRLIDTNYQLTFHDSLSASSPANLFLSPDEGPDDGMTLLVWSKDNGRLLVISNCVGVRQSSPELVDGRKPYLLLTVADRSIRCNASQSALPTFTAADLADFSLPSPVRTSPTTAPMTEP